MLSKATMESELSYAHLHAVAAKAGFACEVRSRHLDGAGVDATITEDGRFLSPDSLLSYVSADIQLKATYTDLPETKGRISFSLTIDQYDKLRCSTVCSPRLLVLLRLPKEQKEWLTVDADALIARRCAYWVSLRGASDITGQAHRTVYVPSANVLTPEALTCLMSRFSRQEVIAYAG